MAFVVLQLSPGATANATGMKVDVIKLRVNAAIVNADFVRDFFLCVFFKIGITLSKKYIQ